MRIVVCVKHVPDIQSERRLTENNRVDRSTDDLVLNELDENAIEEALTLIEELPGSDHEVIALTIGPEAAVDAVRKSLQLGAARGVHVSDEASAGSGVSAPAKQREAAINRTAAEAAGDRA